MSNTETEFDATEVLLAFSAEIERRIAQENHEGRPRPAFRGPSPEALNNGYLSRYRLSQTPRDAKRRSTPRKMATPKPPDTKKLRVKVEIVSNVDGSMFDEMHLNYETSEPVTPRDKPICVQVAINISRPAKPRRSRGHTEAVHLVRKLLDPAANIYLASKAALSPSGCHTTAIAYNMSSFRDLNISAIEHNGFSQRWLHTPFEQEVSLFKDPDSFAEDCMPSSDQRSNKSSTPELFSNSPPATFTRRSLDLEVKNIISKGTVDENAPVSQKNIQSVIHEKLNADSKLYNDGSDSPSTISLRPATDLPSTDKTRPMFVPLLSLTGLDEENSKPTNYGTTVNTPDWFDVEVDSARRTCRVKTPDCVPKLDLSFCEDDTHDNKR